MRYPFPKHNPEKRRKHAEWVQQQIAQLPIGKDWEVILRLEQRQRSNRQNRYMHALIGEIAKHVGMSAEDMKDALVLKFLGAQQERVVGGVTITERVSTAKLKTAACAAFSDQIRSWAAQYLGIVLPLPDQWEDER